ncbi:MAG: TIGR02757 family protein [Myxococcota bacterium]
MGTSIVELGRAAGKRGRGKHVPRARLKAELEGLLAGVDRQAQLRADPVELVHRYEDPADQEVAGLLVAMLAYGRASVVRAKAGALLEALGPSPARGVASRSRLRRLNGFVYRFQRGTDLSLFAEAIGRLRAEAPLSTWAAPEGMAPASGPSCRTGIEAMGRLSAALRAQLRGELSYGLRYLLPSPLAGGGAAKRLALYFRWMVRPADGTDLGTWRGALPPAALLMPLDTHVARLGRHLGLTRRLSPGLPMAEDITEALAELCPEDPLRYDMALCHMGISGACPSRSEPAVCRECGIRKVCDIWNQSRR